MGKRKPFLTLQDNNNNNNNNKNNNNIKHLEVERGSNMASNPGW